MLLTHLKYWREKKGLTLRELAELSKIPYSAISLLENGKREPQGRTARKLAAALEVSVGELYTEAQTPQPQGVELEPKYTPAQPANDNKTITQPRTKQQPAPAGGWWVMDEDDTFGPFQQAEAERLKGKLGRARVYEADSKAVANEQHTEFLREVARGREAW